MSDVQPPADNPADDGGLSRPLLPVEQSRELMTRVREYYGLGPEEPVLSQERL